MLFRLGCRVISAELRHTPNKESLATHLTTEYTRTDANMQPWQREPRHKILTFKRTNWPPPHNQIYYFSKQSFSLFIWNFLVETGTWENSWFFPANRARPGSLRKISIFFSGCQQKSFYYLFLGQLGTTGSFYEPCQCRFVFRTSCVCSEIQNPPIVSTRKKFILKNKKFSCVEKKSSFFEFWKKNQQRDVVEYSEVADSVHARTWSNEKTADMDGLHYSPDDPYYRLGPVHTCLYVRVRETGDWDTFLGPLEWARVETGGADRWVL